MKKIKKEGLVKIYQPSTSIFYNPAQVFNRDLSIIAIKAFSKHCKEELYLKEINAQNKAKEEQREIPPPLKFDGFTILEPLAASGLRSFRYIKELPDVAKCVIVNDLDENSSNIIIENAKLNDISSNQVKVFCSDASSLMHLCNFVKNMDNKGQRLQNIPAGCTFTYKNNENVSSCTLFDTKNDLSNIKNDSITSSTNESKYSSLNLITNSSSIIAENTSNHLPYKIYKDVSIMNGLLTLKEYNACLLDVIDLDPYGTVSPFLDSAVQTIRSGGMLCLTSTDMPVLCGNTPEVAYYKYGGFPSKARYTHEVSLRLLMYAVTMCAAKYKRTVKPFACCSVDFYIRLFVQINNNPIGCKDIPNNTYLASQCTSCDSFKAFPMGHTIYSSNRSHSKNSTVNTQNSDTNQKDIQNDISNVQMGNLYLSSNNSNIKKKHRSAHLPENISKCEECNSSCYLVGPFYGGPLFDKQFVDDCIELCSDNELYGLTMKTKIKGMFTAMKEELLDVVLHYNIPSLFHQLRLSMIKPICFKTALTRLGYRTSHFHRDPKSLKTDAPNYVIYDILRTYANKIPPKNFTLISNNILIKPIKTIREIDLSSPIKENTVLDIRTPRWLPNPQANWGPLAKALRSKRSHKEISFNDVSDDDEEDELEDFEQSNKPINPLLS